MGHAAVVLRRRARRIGEVVAATFGPLRRACNYCEVTVLSCQLPGEAAGQELVAPRMFPVERRDTPSVALRGSTVVACASVAWGGLA